MSGKSKHKGSNFEREVAKKLSLWATNNEDGCLYARRSGSGGAPRDKAGNTGNAGDIFAEKEEGRFLTDATTFELKFYADLQGELWKLLADKRSIFNDFIAQAREDAKVYNRSWTLIFKCNNREVLVLSSFSGFRYILDGINMNKVHTLSIRNEDGFPEECFLFPLEQFLETPASKFREYVTKKSGA